MIACNRLYQMIHYTGKIPGPQLKNSSLRDASALTIVLPHEISNNVVCAPGKASDQPAHTRSLIRAFAKRLNILGVLNY